MLQEGKQGGGATVLLWLFLLSTVPSAFPNRPYCSRMQERASLCAVWVTGGTGLLGFFLFTPTFVLVLGLFPPPFCAYQGRQWDVSCVYCVLQTLSCWDTCPAGIPSSQPCTRSHSFRFGLTKAGGTKEGPVLFCKGQSWGGKAACRDFQLLNQNSKCECFYLSRTSPGLFPQP